MKSKVLFSFYDVMHSADEFDVQVYISNKQRFDKQLFFCMKFVSMSYFLNYKVFVTKCVFTFHFSICRRLGKAQRNLGCY